VVEFVAAAAVVGSAGFKKCKQTAEIGFFFLSFLF
jgi:hypothetical protein